MTVPRSRPVFTVLVLSAFHLVLPFSAKAQPFHGFDSATIPAVTSDWGLKIVVFDVGQADGILLLTPNGDSCLIDSGETNAAGNKIADYLQSPAENGVGTHHGIPKRITLKTLQNNRVFVLITGDGKDSETGDYANSGSTVEDDPGAFTVNSAAVFNQQGDVTVLVSKDGNRYTVTGASFAKTFSAKDSDNQR